MLCIFCNTCTFKNCIENKAIQVSVKSKLATKENEMQRKFSAESHLLNDQIKRFNTSNE